MRSLKVHQKRIRDLLSEQEGAALPEFAIAIFPLLWLFFVFVQVATMFTAHLTLHHAAVVAARCAVIQKGPNLPGHYVSARGFFNGSSGNTNPDSGGNESKSDDNGDAETTCRNAAIAALGKQYWFRTIWNVQTKITYDGGDQYGDVTTETTADYECHGPLLSRRVVCGGGRKSLKITIKLPHEGARYTLEDPANGG